MNKTLTIAAGALIGIAAYASPALAGVDVSINLGQPNFYGRIDMGDAPRPRVIYAEPRVIGRVDVEQEPIYLHVRPGQSRNWSRYCGDYDACGQRVYFVNDNWYNTTYVEHYRHRGESHHDYGRRDSDRHDYSRHDHHRRDYNRHDYNGHDGDRVEDGHGGRYDNGRRSNDNGRGNESRHD